MTSYTQNGDTTILHLAKGANVLIDTEDIEKVFACGGGWYEHRNHNHSYVARTQRAKPKKKIFLIHRIIMDAPDGGIVDHINRNGLDNRKVNLRLVTNAENIRNQAARKNSRTGVRGVRYTRNGKRFIVHVGSAGVVFRCYCQTLNVARITVSMARCAAWGSYAA